MRRGGLSIAAGSAAWGLFWIPLRHLEALGLPSLWAVSAVALASAMAALAVVLIRSEWVSLRSVNEWRVGAALGTACVLYFCGVILSDVIRVILLFYLLPVWTTIAARVLFGEPIPVSRIIVILVALAGVWLLLGGDQGLPIPQDVGDWCGLGAGMFWGLSLALLRGHASTSAAASSFIALFFAGIVSLAACVAFGSLGGWAELTITRIELPGQAAVVALAFGVLVLFPAMFSQIWGARRVPAPTAALLTMAEILVATVSAWLLIGTDMGVVGLLGGAIVIASVLLDIRLQFRAAQIPG